jgi:hypothetical protein
LQCDIQNYIQSIGESAEKILPNIISEEQSAFVPGRIITDNVLIAYECLHFMRINRSKRNAHSALKLDMMKAYDRVEWNYLEAVMLKLGFCQSWVNKVMKCVTLVSFSILFNGEQLQEFKPTRGIRQGDPISPYLFLLCAERLSSVLKGNGVEGRVQCIQVSSSAPIINHLLFADDSILFFKATPSNAKAVHDSISMYCEASGQKVNIFFSKGCRQNVRNEIKSITQVDNGSINEKYLGLPTGVGRSTNGTFKYLKDIIWNKIEGWIEQTLSAGGKEVLIKSVAQVIPTYTMGCFRLPRGLCEHLNSLIWKFWWGSERGKRKTNWVAWESITQPKYMGGLGFRDIEIFNLVMLARQAWRLLIRPHSLCSQILKAVYFPYDDMLNATIGNNPSKTWRAIWDGIEVLKQGLIKRIGDGKSTSIWNCNWIPRTGMYKPMYSKKPNPLSLVCDLIDHATMCRSA